MNSDGKPQRLSVMAYNRDRLHQAYFDLDRVVFVRNPTPHGAEPFETQCFEIRLGPFEEKPFTISSYLGEYNRKRVDIELFDPGIREYRTIVFYVSREGAG